MKINPTITHNEKGWLLGEGVQKTIADLTGKQMLLSFSCGKDAIGTWLACRETFDEIIPFYFYMVPDLEFVEESLVYYERFFGTKIKRLPNPNLYEMINNNSLAPLHRWNEVTQHLGLPKFTRDDVAKWLSEDAGWSHQWTAQGVRESDNLQRRAACNTLKGGINYKRNAFYPIWDWTAKRLEEELIHAGVALPVDYEMFGRSFDGLDFRYIVPIKKHFPRDYDKIAELFPFIETELYRQKNQPLYNEGPTLAATIR